MATGLDWIWIERIRQKTAEGYDAKHDATEDHGELIRAALVYAARAASESSGVDIDLEFLWPWLESERNDRADSTRLLTIAGALIAAELDRRIAVGEEKYAAASKDGETSRLTTYNPDDPWEEIHALREEVANMREEHKRSRAVLKTLLSIWPAWASRFLKDHKVDPGTIEG